MAYPTIKEIKDQSDKIADYDDDIRAKRTEIENLISSLKLKETVREQAVYELQDMIDMAS